MRYAIVYSSATGNTARLAERLRAVLPEGECTFFGAPSQADWGDAERLYVGFWTDKGTCDSETAQLLQGLSGQEIRLFGTAGFGGDQAYFDQILGRVEALIPAGNAVKPGFLCQGKMGAGVRTRYEAMLAREPENERIGQILENFDKALTHPDEADLQALERWALAE